MTSFIIQGTSKLTPKPEKNTRSSLSLSTLHIFSTRLRPPHTAPAARFTPYINTTPYPLLSYCFSTNTRTNLGIGGPLANTPRVWSSYWFYFAGRRRRRRRKGNLSNRIFLWGNLLTQYILRNKYLFDSTTYILFYYIYIYILG